ncbi:hypothetical protein [Aquibacillus albus]|uniref:YrzI family small protein n=1 Tax=Aquibacillus albus TaxID=1168171 RepID=A0ABS2MX72_9BACI|nr:hypothetical protein [Aquibacillus albus]MBM7570393.1 hypothetical protein [Aquibacillus albus]
MKRIYYRFKYNWHLSKFKKLKVRKDECVDQQNQQLIESELNYHERAAFQYMFKS